MPAKRKTKGVMLEGFHDLSIMLAALDGELAKYKLSIDSLLNYKLSYQYHEDTKKKERLTTLSIDYADPYS